MQLKLAGQALLKNLNVRRELHGEDAMLGIDMRFMLRGDTDDLVHFGAALKSLLYAENNLLRMPYLKPLQLTVEYPDHVLHLADMSFDSVKASKFTITPEAEGVVSLTFDVSISGADPACLPQLAVLFVEEACNVDIEAMQASLDLDGEAA